MSATSSNKQAPSPGLTAAQEPTAAPHVTPVDRNLLRVLNGSALESDSVGAASSFDLPPAFTSDRVRRRSDVSRIRPLTSVPAGEAEEIELPVLTYSGQSNMTTTAFRTANVVFREDAAASTSAKGGDPETASGSLHRSDLVEAAADPTTPPVSAEQKALYQRKSLIHFLALCWCVFGMGWNDGTTGPMLPRIQDHYHVGILFTLLENI